MIKIILNFHKNIVTFTDIKRYYQTLFALIMHNKTPYSEPAISSQSIERSELLKRHVPEHPVLSRMRSKLLETNGVQAISGYDRMHHRHNRS